MQREKVFQVERSRSIGLTAPAPMGKMVCVLPGREWASLMGCSCGLIVEKLASVRECQAVGTAGMVGKKMVLLRQFGLGCGWDWDAWLECGEMR